MADESDYITVVPTVAYNRFLVVVMRAYRDEYVQTRISHNPMTRADADALAKSWAAAMKLEIR